MLASETAKIAKLHRLKSVEELLIEVLKRIRETASIGNNSLIITKEEYVKLYESLTDYGYNLRSTGNEPIYWVYWT